MMKIGRYTLAAAAALLTTAGAHAAPWRAPEPGLRHYRYTVVETINRTTQHGYRMDFDLESGRDGSVDAIVLTSEALENGRWTPVSVAPACRTAIHGTDASLARARLWPIAGDIAAHLGNGFLDTCAPGGIFFPLTDILNAVIVPLAQSFHASELHRQGQSVHYPGFTAAFDRAGGTLHETTDGGEVHLAGLDRTRAVIDWQPLLARLDLVERSGPSPVNLHGTEHWAFRITLDRRTGALVSANTIYDDLDLNIVNMPGAPHVTIGRVVTIATR